MDKQVIVEATRQVFIPIIRRAIQRTLRLTEEQISGLSDAAVLELVEAFHYGEDE